MARGATASRLALQPYPELFAAYLRKQGRRMSALREDITAPGSDRDLALTSGHRRLSAASA